jgi:hypothetical protein
VSSICNPRTHHDMATGTHLSLILPVPLNIETNILQAVY